MSENYRDLWRDYVSIFESTRKKFLKKPNYTSALDEFENLALQFQDIECESYTGMCNIQLAKIYENLGNWSMQYSRLLKAARYFKDAEYKSFMSASYVCSDNLNHMQDCYNQATKLILGHNGVWLAGLHSMELGHALYEVDHPQLAIKYLSRGAHFLEIEHNSRMGALAILARCQCRLKYYSDALSTLDELWTSHMKSVIEPRSGSSGRNVLKDCEMATVLLLLKIQSSDISPRHRFLLSMYDEGFFQKLLETSEKTECVGNLCVSDVGNADVRSPTKSDVNKSMESICRELASKLDEAPWNKFPLKDSSLNRKEFLLFYDFILALRNGKLIMAKYSFSHLQCIMDDTSIMIAADLLSSVAHKGRI